MTDIRARELIQPLEYAIDQKHVTGTQKANKYLLDVNVDGSLKITDVNGNMVALQDVAGIISVPVKVTDIVIDKSGDSIATEAFEQSKRIDEVSTTLTYFGSAAVGSSEGSAVWKIKRLSISGAITSVAYADGNINYDNIWANRASLTYT